MTGLLEQLQQYPKTWEKFARRIMQVGTEYSVSLDGKQILNGDGYRVNIYERNGLLTDFCDGEGYYVYVYPIKGQDGHYWHYAINFEDGSRFFSAEKLKLEDEIKPFDSRQEAFEQGIIKAFSLMENK
ncbi:MAG: hypothetical protein WC974_09340 [Thermoplasmata archaeon]